MTWPGMKMEYRLKGLTGDLLGGYHWSCWPTASVSHRVGTLKCKLQQELFNGAHARSDACCPIWAVSHAFGRRYFAPFARLIAKTLISVTLLCQKFNCCLAASATLPEWVASCHHIYSLSQSAPRIYMKKYKCTNRSIPHDIYQNTLGQNPTLSLKKSAGTVKSFLF